MGYLQAGIPEDMPGHPGWTAESLGAPQLEQPKSWRGGQDLLEFFVIFWGHFYKTPKDWGTIFLT